MGIERIRMIVENRRKRMTEKLEECVVVVWREWSEQAGELQVFRADTKNREKSRDHFYKMDMEKASSQYVRNDQRIFMLWLKFKLPKHEKCWKSLRMINYNCH